MFSIRSLLDFLADYDVKAIDRLCDIHEISAWWKAKKCDALERSYGDDYEQFFADLLKEDLVALLYSPTDIDGEEYYLPYARSYPKANLIQFALRIFRDEKPPRQFVRIVDDEEDDDDDEDDYEEEVDDDEEDDDDDDAEEDEEDEATGADLSGLAEVDLLGAVSASVAKQSPKLLEWIAQAAGTPTAELTSLVRQAHGNTLLRNVLEASWPIDVPDGAGPVLATLRISAARRAPTLLEWVKRLVGVTFEEVQQAVQDAAGNNTLRSLFPALIAEARGREGGVLAKPASSEKRLFGGRYKLGQKIADGGFGAVFEARDTRRRDNRHVVIKVAHPEATHPKAAELLRQEVQIGEQLRHQNICVYLALEDDPLTGVFAVLDHGGHSLDTIINDRGSMPIADVIEVTTQLARALDYAHERNVLHQDVKPQNVLMQALRGRWEVRLADFGVAVLGRTGFRTDGARTVDASELIGYTLPYAAPEQLWGVAKRASDQYSLALVACSMLEGRVFKEPERYRPRAFRQLAAEQNVALLRALSLSPDDRFDSCEEFARSLRGRS